MSSFPMIEIVMPNEFKAPPRFSPSEKTTDAEKKSNLPTILVVDDERLVADTLSEILEDSGYFVITAYDGWEALEMANKIRPNYLLTDVLMPRMNGVELAIAVTKMQPAVRILLFSGNNGVSEILDDGRKQGYEFETLGKPVHPNALLKILSELR
jgi:CheY-like chemotaxis protein